MMHNKFKKILRDSGLTAMTLFTSSLVITIQAQAEVHSAQITECTSVSSPYCAGLVAGQEQGLKDFKEKQEPYTSDKEGMEVTIPDEYNTHFDQDGYVNGFNDGYKKELEKLFTSNNEENLEASSTNHTSETKQFRSVSLEIQDSEDEMVSLVTKFEDREPAKTMETQQSEDLDQTELANKQNEAFTTGGKDGVEQGQIDSSKPNAKKPESKKSIDVPKITKTEKYNNFFDNYFKGYTEGYRSGYWNNWHSELEKENNETTLLGTIFKTVVTVYQAISSFFSHWWG